MEDDMLFSNILTFAWLKATESAFYFWKMAHDCADMKNKIFLLYCALKKRHQVSCIEKIAGDLKAVVPLFNEYEDNFYYLHEYTVACCRQSLDEVFAFSYEHAKREIEFCKLLKILRKNKTHHALLESLIGLAEEFLVDVETGFSKINPSVYASIQPSKAGRNF